MFFFIFDVYIKGVFFPVSCLEKIFAVNDLLKCFYRHYENEIQQQEIQQQDVQQFQKRLQQQLQVSG